MDLILSRYPALSGTVGDPTIGAVRKTLIYLADVRKPLKRVKGSNAHTQPKLTFGCMATTAPTARAKPLQRLWRSGRPRCPRLGRPPG
eukprot:scaffold37278_cov38-Phaeocystis_antarctica.AAC.1